MSGFADELCWIRALLQPIRKARERPDTIGAFGFREFFAEGTNHGILRNHAVQLLRDYNLQALPSQTYRHTKRIDATKRTKTSPRPRNWCMVLH